MSILPPREKDGEIKFIFYKNLPYRSRLFITAAFLLTGLAVQLFFSFWAGLALLAAGSALGMVSGYNSAPKHDSMASVWERVTPDEYFKVRLKAAELAKWDEDFFDGTNSKGVLGLAVAVTSLIFLYLVLDARFHFPEVYWFYLAIDAVVVFLPLWLTGTREYLRKDKLIIKINALERVMAALSDPSSVQVYPMLSMVKTESGRQEPVDARLMIKIVGAPKDFYGVQAQVSINSVQGKDYPYLYCVLIAKTGAGLLENYESFTGRGSLSPAGAWQKLFFVFRNLFNSGGGEVVYEASSPDEVDIIVVRQLTTEQSGYYTSPAAAAGVVKTSLDLADKLIEKNGQAGPPPPPAAH